MLYISKFSLILKLTTIGLHCGAMGEVFQLSTMCTKFEILEMESSFIERKVLKGEAVMLTNPAQS